MRVALIDPPGINSGLNVGLGMLAACLSKYGHKVRVVDLNNNLSRVSARLRDIRDYDLIGFSIKSFTLAQASRIAKSFKRSDLVYGGPHVTLDGLNLLKEEQGFRFAIIGEGEETLVELVDALEKGTGFDGIRGIIYRSKSRSPEIRLNPQRE